MLRRTSMLRRAVLRRGAHDKAGPAVTVHQVLGDQRRQEFAYTQAGAAQRVEEKLPIGVVMRQQAAGVASYFLPKGYPASVSAGYDSFVRGQMASMMFSTASGVLSMQSMLFALGLGVGSFPLAATLNWIIKDGLGQLGGVIFAGLVNNQFDADAKRWRMIASISLDVSSFIELLTPLAPGYFLPLAGVANVGKNVSFLAASATRAAIHKSFATHENLADVTAKTGSQCILSSLAGTGLGLSLAAGLGGDYPSTLATFVGLSAASLAATYASLRGVTLTTLGSQRLDFVVSEYLDRTASAAPGAGVGAGAGAAVGAVRLLQPREVADREVLLGAPDIGTVPATIGADLPTALPSAAHLRAALAQQRGRGYLLSACAYPGSPGAGEVFVLFKQGCSRADVLAGAVHAVVLRRALREEAGLVRGPPVGLLRRLSAAAAAGAAGARMGTGAGNGARAGTGATAAGHGEGDRVWRGDLVARVSDARTKATVDAIAAALLAGHAPSSPAAASTAAAADDDAPSSGFASASDSGAGSAQAQQQGAWLVEELLLESRYARVALPPGLEAEAEAVAVAGR